jgi:ABC-type transporter Mla MlaB component
MLRIIEQENDRSLSFKLAGKLVRDWAPELERCWQQAVARQEFTIVRVDLTEVTFVDDAGKRLLAAMANTGVELIAADVLMKALVEQIAQGRVFVEGEVSVPT